MKLVVLILRPLYAFQDDTLLDYLKSKSDLDVRIINELPECKKFIINGFNGFIFFQLDPSKIPEWVSICQPGLTRYFSIFYQSNLSVQNLHDSLLAKFDFIIVNEHPQQHAFRIIDFLELYYWKKIPINLFCQDCHDVDPLLKKVFKIIETSNCHSLTLEAIAHKLKVETSAIRYCLKKHLKISFTQLKKKLFDYYKVNFPCEFSDSEFNNRF